MNVLIVDDNSHAHEWLGSQLKQHSAAMTQLHHAYSLTEAREKVKASKPDLIFLDVELGDGLGFELIESLKDGPTPHVVVISGEIGYASRAFRVAAIDFLAKPFELEHFKEALDRVETAPTKPEQLDFAAEFQKQPGTQKLIIRQANDVHFVEVEDIHYLEAYGNYTDIYGKFGKITTASLLRIISSVLDPFQLHFRIHKTYVVNCNEVAKIDKVKLEVVLKSGTRIPIGPKFKEPFYKKMGL